MTAGRRKKVCKDAIFEQFEKNFSQIFDKDGVLLPKTHPIWDSISDSLLNKIKSTSLYTYACEFRKIKQSELPTSIDENISSTYDQNESTNDVSLFDNSLNNSLIKDNEILVELLLSTSDFSELTEKYTSYNKAKKRKLTKTCLKPGVYQDLINTGIYEKIPLRCGFYFKNHYINSESEGSINGR